MEVVQASEQPFIAVTGVMIKNSILSRSLAEGNMGSQEKNTWTQRVLVEIQNEAAKLLKVTIIVPYRQLRGLIIEDIDDD